MRAPRLALLPLVALVACDTPEPSDYGDPTSLSRPSTAAGITAYIAAPRVGQALTSSTLSLSVAAYTEDGPQPLTVTVLLPDGTSLPTTVQGDLGIHQRFNAEVPLLQGTNSLSIRIANADQSRLRYLAYAVRYTGPAPGVRAALGVGTDASNPCANPSLFGNGLTRARRVCLSGRATAASGATVQGVSVQGSPMSPTLDAMGAFALPVDLQAQQANTFTLTVTDSMGRTGTASASVIHDGIGPNLTVEGITDGRTVVASSQDYMLSGTATDDNGVASLRVEFGDGGVLPLEVRSPWSATVRLHDGDNPMALVAVDRAGNSTRVGFTLRRDREVELRAPRAGAGSTQLNLDRYALASLLSPADQMAIRLVQVSLRPTLVATLRAIRSPFTSGVDTSTWRSPEWNLYHLLNMTPDTANLQGTSLAPMLQLAAAIGLPPARILAELLQSTVTTPFVDLDTVADVLLEQLVGTHPNAARDAMGVPVLNLSMYDVLQDLQPLAARFGPVGMHPGFLTGRVGANLFEPGFLMSIPARSNLTQFEGVDFSSNAKTYLFLRTGTGMATLELDFTSANFGVSGLVDQPTVDLSFSITENPAFLRAGTTQLAGADAARPGFYRGNGAVWSAQPWQIERIVAEAAYRQLYNRFSDTMYARTLNYNAGSIMNAATINWARGWVTIMTSGGVGMPPPPAYVWDVLSETAQVRLHDGGIPEGMANLAFTLSHLSIGLTADQLVTNLRPTLMAQQADLSRRIVGTGALAGSSADVFYLPSTDASAPGFLAFRAMTDTADPYNYQHPGFFRDMALTQRASATTQAGSPDTTHEKVPATVGATYFVQDNLGTTYTLTVTERTAQGVRVRFSRAGGTP